VCVPDDIDENTHVAVSRKCKLFVLDATLPLCLDKLITQCSFGSSYNVLLRGLLTFDKTGCSKISYLTEVTEAFC